jgi:hypothetical protein
LLNVAADERAQARFRFTRKGSRKDHDSSERARFTIDRRIGPFVVGPDLRSGERDKKAEDNAQWRQHSRGDCLECPPSLALGEGRDERVDCRRYQIRKAENDQRHPNNGQIVQPVAHV